VKGYFTLKVYPPPKSFILSKKREKQSSELKLEVLPPVLWKNFSGIKTKIEWLFLVVAVMGCDQFGCVDLPYMSNIGNCHHSRHQVSFECSKRDQGSVILFIIMSSLHFCLLFHRENKQSVKSITTQKVKNALSIMQVPSV